ncbi:MAG: hypothetical protein IPM35_30370 [Myxococcales bacterium]|nr:hypothetical protein [Myxococcales bacterium]
MRTRSVFSVTLVTLAGFFGCSSSGTSPGPTSSGPISLQDFPDAYANTLCDNLASCCTQSGYPYDANKCKAVVKGFVGLFGGLVDKGTVKYDASAAGACMGQVPAYAKGCLQGSLDSAACESVFVGTVPQGGTCTQSAECVAPPGGDADCDQGKCVEEKRGLAGDACGWTCTEQGSSTSCSGTSGDSNTRCFTNDGLYCESSSNTCKQRVAIGAGPCDSAASCVDGAFCQSQTCTAQKAVGEACTDHDECTSSAYCEQTCLTKKPLGAACTDDFADEECADGACEGGKCVKDSNSSVGMFCGGSTN